MDYTNDIKKYLTHNMSKSIFELTEDILINWRISPEEYASDPEFHIQEAFSEAQDAMCEAACHYDDPHGDRDTSPEVEAGWAMQDKIDMYRAEY